MNPAAAPDLPSYAEFEAQAHADGFDQVLERHWEPGTVLETHTHPFDVRAIVVQGEMWLSCQGEVLHLRAGDRFALQRELPHDERYGAEGATYWVARRHGLAPG